MSGINTLREQIYGLCDDVYDFSRYNQPMHISYFREILLDIAKEYKDDELYKWIEIYSNDNDTHKIGY